MIGLKNKNKKLCEIQLWKLRGAIVDINPFLSILRRTGVKATIVGMVKVSLVIENNLTAKWEGFGKDM